MRRLNLGIVAHVDAGKTSLTERLLYAAGVIDEIGRVDDGNTQTDTLALERQRGITIKSAVVSFVVDGVAINLIDTPGHPDFIAEVERALNLLDGAVLVISAAEGVQAQTRVLLRALQRLRVPTVIFVNKIDRAGARHEGVLREIAEKLTPAIVAMGTVHDLGGAEARFAPYGATDRAFAARLAELLADHDDAVLGAYLEDGTTPGYGQLLDALAAQTRQVLVHPVYFGSAITGAGVESLISGITTLLPAAEGGADGPVSGSVFKIERGEGGEKIAYARLYSGTVRRRDRLSFGRGHAAKVTAINVFDRGSAIRSESVVAGQIAKLWGLGAVRIGDAIGGSETALPAYRFAPPTLEAVVVPCRSADRRALRGALVRLAEEDPLINLRQDEAEHELSVSLYGEVQKEVLRQVLADDFGIEVEFRETTTICIERPVGTGTALETAPDPFLATIGLRVEPAAIGSGLTFGLEVEFGSIPLAFHKAVEEAVTATLRQGLYGWQVTDCAVTMTHAVRLRHFATSTAAEHRKLAPLVVMAALRQAGTVVCEPIHRFHLELPADTLGAIAPALARLEAVAHSPATGGASSCTLDGEIAAARIHDLREQLPALTRGEGVLDTAFDRYQPVRGRFPTRPRADANPLDRNEYLLRLRRQT